MITIREMEIDDISEVAAIEDSLFSKPWGEVGFFSFLMREDTLFLVAEEEGTIVGYCGVVMVLDEGDITNVAVLSNRQGRGIGRQLVQALIQKTEERGVVHLHLEVRESNQRAIALYESLAFEKAGLRKNYYEAPVENGLIMNRG